MIEHGDAGCLRPKPHLPRFRQPSISDINHGFTVERNLEPFALKLDSHRLLPRQHRLHTLRHLHDCALASDGHEKHLRLTEKKWLCSAVTDSHAPSAAEITGVTSSSKNEAARDHKLRLAPLVNAAQLVSDSIVAGS